MKANWLILTMERAHGVWAVYESVENAGYTVKSAAQVPIERDSVYPEGSCVVVNGPAARIAELKAVRDWTPIGWCDGAAFDCHAYYHDWGEHLLQRRYLLTSFAEMARDWQSLYDQLSSDDRLFIRPDSHDKIFDGGLVAESDFDIWHNRLIGEGVSLDTPCVVSRPEEVGDEWRLVIRNRRVIAGSSYRIGGRVVKTELPPADVIGFAEAVAAQPYESLPNLYVMDVCATSGRLAIVEVGSINSSGFYGCDLSVVIPAISEEAEAEWSRRQARNHK